MEYIKRVKRMNDGSNAKVLERQIELLQMMKDVHNYFEIKEISYSLCGGSLLGAIRHNGFIPWDDDMDIFMDRENYSKLVNNSFDLDGYSLKKDLWVYRIRKNDKEDKDEATIDIFVVDNMPDNNLVCKVKVFLIKILQGMLKEDIYYSNYSLVYKACVLITHFLGKLFSKELLLKIYDYVSCISNGKNTKYKTCYNTLFKYLSLRMDSNICLNVSLHDFEDTKFFTTNLYDDYLRKQYGDYWVLPKEEMQVPSHIR